MSKTQLQTNNTKYSQLIENLRGKAVGGGADINLQSKTVTPTESSQIVTPDSTYDGLSSVVVNAIPTTAQATPSISVNTSGLITAEHIQSAGYVVAGTRRATKQLTTQSAKTVTPTTSDQTAVASGRYTTGTITIKGDANLKAENIKSGVSIFDVTGSYEGSGGGAQEATVTISIPKPSMAPPAPPSASISFTAPALTVESVSLSGYGTSVAISVAIGTIISITATISEMWKISDITGGIATILDIGKMGQAYYAFKVTDTNGTIALHL